MRISDWSSDVCSSDLEEIGCDIAGRGQPLRCAGNQPFDRIADPQQRAAGKREDQLGIGAEQFGVAMVVTISEAVLLFARVVAPGAVVVARVVQGGGPLANPPLPLATGSPPLLFRGPPATIYHPDPPP